MSRRVAIGIVGLGRMDIDGYTWAEGDAWWAVGIPLVSDREQVRVSRAALEAGKKHQRVDI